MHIKLGIPHLGSEHVNTRLSPCDISLNLVFSVIINSLNKTGLTYLLTAAIVSSASSSGYDMRSFESENR